MSMRRKSKRTVEVCLKFILVKYNVFIMIETTTEIFPGIIS